MSHGSDAYCLLCRSAWAHGAPKLPELDEQGLCERCNDAFRDLADQVGRVVAARRARLEVVASVVPLCLCGHERDRHDQTDGPAVCRDCFCEVYEVEE